MPWSETNRMEQRARFVLDVLEGRFTMSELCYRYGVSRKTGYKWLERYHKQGREGCSDRSRAPQLHPNSTNPRIAARIVKLRRKHPSWGARTLHGYLVREFPNTPWPCSSTIGDILKRNELIKKRRRRSTRATWQRARTQADRANRVWTADFKGQFRLGNGRLCYPLTILDAFREYGLPDVIRTDNGVPFCGPGSVLGLSRLSVWLLKLGITLERSRPGKPQDNGAHERMHRTLKQTALQRPRATEAAQQRALNQFRRIYNEERPHHALQMKSPASCYSKSVRAYPEDIPDPVYPAHFELRRVSKIGVFAWKQRQIFVTEALHNETVGFESIADRLWSVFFGDVMLGRFSELDYQFTPGMGR
jgi:putative transposase